MMTAVNEVNNDKTKQRYWMNVFFVVFILMSKLMATKLM